MEAHIEERERIREAVVALVTKDGALDQIAASDRDLFTFLYTAMTERAEDSDATFTHADLNDLWDSIVDDLERHSITLLGPKLEAAPKDKRGQIKKLWAELLDALRTAGPARIGQRGFVAPDAPSPVRGVWDRFWEAVTADDAPPTYSDGLEELMSELGITAEERQFYRDLLPELDHLFVTVPAAIRSLKDIGFRDEYRREIRKYSREMLKEADFQRLKFANDPKTAFNEIDKIAKKASGFRNHQLVAARKKGSEVARALSQLVKRKEKISRVFWRETEKG